MEAKNVFPESDAWAAHMRKGHFNAVSVKGGTRRGKMSADEEYEAFANLDAGFQFPEHK